MLHSRVAYPALQVLTCSFLDGGLQHRRNIRADDRVSYLGDRLASAPTACNKRDVFIVAFKCYETAFFFRERLEAAARKRESSLLHGLATHPQRSLQGHTETPPQRRSLCRHQCTRP